MKSFQYAEHNNYASTTAIATTFTTVQGPACHNEHPKPKPKPKPKLIKKKRSTSSLKYTRDSPRPRLSALTPIRKRGDSASNSNSNSNNERPHDNGSFKSSIRRIAQMSVTSSSRQSQSSADDDSDEPLTQEASTVMPLPTVEVQIPDTAIGSLGYQTFDGAEENYQVHEPPEPLAIVSAAAAAAAAEDPPSYPEIMRQASKRSNGTRKSQKLLSARTNSMSCDPSNTALIINRSRPNSRSSLYACSENQSPAKNSYDSDETLCNHRSSESCRNEECESSKSATAGQLDGDVNREANCDAISAEEALRSLALTRNAAVRQSINDRALLPSQKGKALVDGIRRGISPMTCRGALHSLSCEHLSRSFRSMGLNPAAANKDSAAIYANELRASKIDLENLKDKTVLQTDNLRNLKVQNPEDSHKTGPENCNKEVKQMHVQHRTAVLHEQVNNDSKDKESKQYSTQQMPRYDDWEESPIEEPPNYRHCDPNEFL